MRKNQKLMLGAFILALLFVIIFFYLTTDSSMARKELKYSEWNGPKSLLKEYVDSIVKQNEDIEFYNPTRRRGQEYSVRVRYKRMLSFDFVGGTLIPVNERSSEVLERILKEDVAISEHLFKKRLVAKVYDLERAGIYSIIRTDSFVKVCTTYYDSTYETLAYINPLYIKYSQSEIKDVDLKKKKFALGFFFFFKKMSQSDLKYLSRNYYLWSLDSSNYYFRVHLPF